MPDFKMAFKGDAVDGAIGFGRALTPSFDDLLLVLLVGALQGIQIECKRQCVVLRCGQHSKATGFVKAISQTLVFLSTRA
jgi:hypothetical protein